MTSRIRIGLRDTACEPPEGEGSNPGGMWYRLEREVVPLLRRVLAAVNDVGPGFGGSVDITTADSPYTMSAATEYIRADTTDGNITLLLPASATTSIRFLSIKKTDVTVNTVVVTAFGDEDLDGGATAPVTSGQTFIRLIPRGSGYDIA